MIVRTGTAALLGLIMTAMIAPGLARADVCTDSGGYNIPPVPQCEVQTKAPVPYDFWQTQGWAYYCTGDHPYFWGLQEGYIGTYTWAESGFTGTQNEFYEGPNKLDATFTNWKTAQNLTVSLACSAQPQPDIQGCTTTGGPVRDPGCPQANIQNHCSGGSLPLCMQTYTETCSSGVEYDCSAVFGAEWCLQCAPGSKAGPSKRAIAAGVAAAGK